MNDDPRTHPDSLTGADVFDVPDTSLSPAYPDGLVEWLRELPPDTVLLDRDSRAWQLLQWSFENGRGGVANWAWFGANVHAAYGRFNETELRKFAEHAPFRVIWTSGGGPR